MPKDDPSFVDQFDWEHDSDAHYHKMMDDAHYEDSERLPARIVVKIKSKKNDNQTNKRAPRGASKKRL